MTPRGDDPRVVERTIPRFEQTGVAAAASDGSVRAAAAGAADVARDVAPDAVAFQRANAALNDTHAMAEMRARAGRVVRTIEERRRRLVARAVRRALPSRAAAPGLVLDIGCEDGWIAEAYVDQVGHTVLCDLDARRLHASPLALRSDVTVLEDDALAPRTLRSFLGSRRADVILLSALLEHLPTPAHAIDQLDTLLAPGGALVVYLPADGPILALKQILKRTRLGGLIRGLPLEPAPGHLHVFDRRSTRVLLSRAGRLEHLHFDPVCLGYVGVVRKPHSPRGGRA